MKKLIFILAILAPCIAHATAYTSAATGNWNNTSTWSPSGIPGSGDTCTLANSFTVTIPAGYTAFIGTSPVSTGTAACACASATGTGILIVNGTLDFQGPINQCAKTWQVNPQAAVATATGTFSIASTAVTLASISGTVAVGQGVVCSTGSGSTLVAGTVNGTLVSAISGTSLTLNLPTIAAGSGVSCSFFTPSLIHDSSLAASPSTTNYGWAIGYASCAAAPCALLDLNGTSTDPVVITNAVSSGNSGGFGVNGGTLHATGAMNATYTVFNGCGTSAIECTYFFGFAGATGLTSSITNSTFVSSGQAEIESYAANTTIIFNNNTVVSPLNSIFALQLTVTNTTSGDSCQVEQNYIEGQYKEINGITGGTDNTCVVVQNVITGNTTNGPYIGLTTGHATGHFDLNMLVNQTSTQQNSAFGGISVTRTMLLETYAQTPTFEHLTCVTVDFSTVINGGLIEHEYADPASGDIGTSACIILGSETATYPVTVEGVIAIPAVNGTPTSQIVGVAGTCTSSNCPQITAIHNDGLPIPAANSFGVFNLEGSTGIAGLFQEIADNNIAGITSGAGYSVECAVGCSPVANTFENVGNNNNYNNTGTPYTGLYGPSSTPYNPTAGTYGGGDISVNPQYLGCAGSNTPALLNCNFKGWATSQGIAFTTWADIFNQFRAMNTPGAALTPSAILAVYNWERAGWAPTNPAMHGTAYTTYTPVGGALMQDIGAIPYVSATSPFWMFPTP